ncbi:hypothetical protein Zm00014a_014312 [Zea mays]|uniref:Uncharacterized protein n=1 Tax=Zea mays TaxID=4577 RepID=A0A3L6FIR4_MAIZE|nr:hypothetical protein Zm00014a_014312 [Zea mays]
MASSPSSPAQGARLLPSHGRDAPNRPPSSPSAGAREPCPLCPENAELEHTPLLPRWTPGRPPLAHGRQIHRAEQHLCSCFLPPMSTDAMELNLSPLSNPALKAPLPLSHPWRHTQQQLLPPSARSLHASSSTPPSLRSNSAHSTLVSAGPL